MPDWPRFAWILVAVETLTLVEIAYGLRPWAMAPGTRSQVRELLAGGSGQPGLVPTFVVLNALAVCALAAALAGLRGADPAARREVRIIGVAVAVLLGLLSFGFVRSLEIVAPVDQAKLRTGIGLEAAANTAPFPAGPTAYPSSAFDSVVRR